MTKTVRAAYRASNRMTGKRRALMLSCASMAIAAAAMAPQEARAQAFNGTVASSTNATQTSVGTGTSTITVTAPTATINWTPTGGGTGNIDFLPSGNTATFTSSSGITDYTVLNRIVPGDPGRAIELNGTVIATLQGTATTGGNVWFYSPGGIVVGANAVFDVGGLLLSTVDLTSFSNSASGFTADFAMTQQSAGSIQILNGAQINALQQNSYVALVAPRIEQGGSVRVDGSAAYVAAEALTMTMNQGLFDIQVDIDGGTSDANGIVHTGSTTGPANATANHKIYMAAVPKNQALTMLLSGTVGYDATTAFVDGGEIILSAGWTPRAAGNFSSWAAITEGAIHITGGNFTSNVEGISNRGITADTTTASLNFAGNVDFYGHGPLTLSASGERSLTIGGTASLRTWDASTITLSATGGGLLDIGGNTSLSSEGVFNGDLMLGGTIAVTADGGTIDIGGVLDADVSSYADGPNTDGFSMDARGGTITLNATGGGTITAGGLHARADAQGGYNAGGGDQTGGAGAGGEINVHALGGSIDINGVVYADASGDGGDVAATGLAGGAGTGGLVDFRAEGGTIDIQSSVTAIAEGTGGYVYHTVGTTAIGGAGNGGDVGLSTAGPGSLILVGGAILLDASAYGGSGQTGGAATGGVTWVESFGGGIEVTGGMSLYAQASGGSASAGFGGTGGFAQGGTTAIEANGVGSSIIGSSVYLDTGAWGGNGGAGDGVEIAAGSGGDAQGGLYNGTRGSGGAFLLADSAGGNLQVGNVTMYADGFGGQGGTGGAGQAGGAGGDAFGGTVQAGTFNPSQGTAAAATVGIGNLYMNAAGYAGNGGAGDQGAGGAAMGAGGNAEAGLASVGARGTVTIAGATLDAHAYGGEGSIGGNAIGGVSQIINSDSPGSTLNVTGSASLDSDGIAGDGGISTGGYAGIGSLGPTAVNVGGSVNLTVEGANGLAEAERVVATAGIGAYSGGDVVLGTVSAGSWISSTSAGTTFIEGLVSAPWISLVSSDLAIGTGGQLGVAGLTELIELGAVSDSNVVIGGVADAGLYHLSQDEADRIEAGALNFYAQGVSDTHVDVVVHDLYITGSEAGGISHVQLGTSGNVIIDGIVHYDDAGPSDFLSIYAGNSIQVVTDTGGIGMTASDGSLSGLLMLGADNVWVASQAIINQLTADPNFSGRDTALATNSGTANPGGYVRAGSVSVDISETFFVQNSAMLGSHGGISVGDGGLSVNNWGEAEATVVGHGRRENSDETLTEDDAFADSVQFSGSGFTADSAINGCAISTACTVPPPPPLLRRHRHRRHHHRHHRRRRRRRRRRHRRRRRRRRRHRRRRRRRRRHRRRRRRHRRRRRRHRRHRRRRHHRRHRRRRRRRQSSARMRSSGRRP